EAAGVEVGEVGAIVGVAPPRRGEACLAEEPPAGEHRGVRAAALPDVRDEIEPPLAVEGDLAADEVEAIEADRQRRVDDPAERPRVGLRVRLEVAVPAMEAVEVADGGVL